MLNSVATTALQSNRAALLVLLGDAGMGKSRIVAETTASLECARDAIVLEGRCVPYGEVNAWWPLADALRGALPADAGDPIETIEPRLRDLVVATATPDRSPSEVDRTTAGLLQLFGFAENGAPPVGSDPDRIRDEVTRCFVTFLEDLTDARPVVLWLSDLHWADPVVHDLVGTALAALARRPLVVVVTARRSLLERWQPPVGRFDTFALNLEALDAEATDTLIEALVRESGTPTMSEAAKADLRERSGGNPLFLIELLALLGEQRASYTEATAELTALPDTLRGLVAARLDNLGPDERAIVDDASVLGRRGKVEHLAEMARQIRGNAEVTSALAAVATRELLRLDGDGWEFTSDVTREVAYGMLTKSDRAKKHLGVAQWVESARSGPVTDRVADLLAHHYGRAAELLDDLGTVERLSDDIRERALHWIDDVSARGERMRLLPAVDRLCTQGLALAGDGYEQVRLTLLLRRAGARSQARDSSEAREDALAAGELAEALGDDAARAAVQLVEGEIARQRGDLDGARATFADAARRFDEAGDTEGRAEALRALGLAELFAGRTAQAEKTTSDALEAFRALGRPAGEAWALQNLAWISFVQGRIAEAEQRIGESLELFESVGNTGGTAWARGLQGFVRLAEGDLAAAETLQRSVLADAQASGDRWATAMMQLLGSVVTLWTGRTDEAQRMATDGLGLFRAVHDRLGQARIVWPLARAMAMRGDLEAARAMLDEVREAVEATPEWRDNTEDRSVLSVARASVEVHVGNPDVALAELAWLTDELGLDVVAAWLRSGDGGTPPAPLIDAFQTGAGLDLVTVVGTAMMQVGRVREAAMILDAASLDVDDVQVSAALRAAVALVRAAEGRPTDARACAATVLDDDRASYLDRALSAVASGLAAARLGDMDAVSEAFGIARASVDHTGDLLTRSLVQLAEERAFDALAVGVGANRVASGRTTEGGVRLSTMGTDAHGWLRLFDLAL
ncbi:MAG TPA: AAA family ATPase, partial [Acidimicrobiales bacterium]|nr:AAA family ATPase [Acidimicrobiales bacterium]